MQTTKHRTLACLASVFLAAWAPAASSQQPSVPGAAIEMVRLDAVVTDARGHLVKDLKKDDFVVLEDGKRQAVQEFLLAAREAVGEAAPPAESSKVTGTAQSAPATIRAAHHVVIVVDDLHIAKGNIDFAKGALHGFVGSSLGPDDDVALVATSGRGGVPALTHDRAAVAAAIDQLASHDTRPPRARTTDLTPEVAEQILRGDINALTSQATKMTDDPGDPFNTHGYGSGGIAGVGASSHLAGSSGVLSQDLVAASQEAERRARGVLAEALYYSVSTLATVESVIRGLARLPGRKLCLLLSDGFLTGAGTSEERLWNLESVVDAATRSGAVVYALDSKGLATSVQDASSVTNTPTLPDLESGVARQAEQQLATTLEQVSGETGGFLVHGTNDLEGGLHRMLQDNESYYLMAYEPTNTKRDGRFRKIEVRIAGHPDYSVRTRAGYFAPGGKEAAKTPPAPPKLPPAELDALSLQAILATPLPEGGGVPLKMTADYLEQPSGGPEVIVRAVLDVTRLHWEEAGGRHQASFDLAGAFYDGNGAVVGAPFGRHVDLDAENAEYDRMKREGLHLQQRVSLAPGRYEVRLLARDAKGAAAGGSAQAIEIPDLHAGKLAISGLFLSASTAAAGSAAPGSREGLRDVQALRRFKSTESLYFQLYVYNPEADANGGVNVVLQAQIWSQGKLVAASKPQPAAFRKENGVLAPETEGLPLAGLRAGAYVLKVVVVDQMAKATVSRSVDFTVE